MGCAAASVWRKKLQLLQQIQKLQRLLKLQLLQLLHPEEVVGSSPLDLCR